MNHNCSKDIDCDTCWEDAEQSCRQGLMVDRFLELTNKKLEGSVDYSFPYEPQDMLLGPWQPYNTTAKVDRHYVEYNGNAWHR